MFNLSYSFVMPPTVLIVVCLLAALLALAQPRAGAALMLAGSVLLYLSALPAVATLLLRQVEAAIPIGPDPRGAQAIVVLAGDMHPGNGSDAPDALAPVTLERILYAARLYRIVGLPVAVSGGHVRDMPATAGALMRDALVQDFAVPVTWTEERSRTTFENARFCAQLLKPAKITSVFVVTSAWHMPRALWSFEHFGLHAIPWPTPRSAAALRDIDDFLPSADAFGQTFLALHEILGLVYYRLRY